MPEVKPKPNPEPKICFYKPNRIYADGRDTLNWLNHLNKNIAERFKKKMEGAEEKIKENLKGSTWTLKTVLKEHADKHPFNDGKEVETHCICGCCGELFWRPDGYKEEELCNNCKDVEALGIDCDGLRSDFEAVGDDMRNAMTEGFWDEAPKFNKKSILKGEVNYPIIFKGTTSTTDIKPEDVKISRELKVGTIWIVIGLSLAFLIWCIAVGSLVITVLNIK